MVTCIATTPIIIAKVVPINIELNVTRHCQLKPITNTKDKARKITATVANIQKKLLIFHLTSSCTHNRKIMKFKITLISDVNPRICVTKNSSTTTAQHNIIK